MLRVFHVFPSKRLRAYRKQVERALDEVCRKYGMMVDVCDRWGRTLGENKLFQWSDFSGDGHSDWLHGSFLAGQHDLLRMLCRERLGLVRHRIGEAWNDIWAIKPLARPRELSLQVRLQRLRAHVLPVLTWGAHAWRLRKDCLSSAEGAMIRMARIPCMIFARQPRDGWTGTSEPEGISRRYAPVVPLWLLQRVRCPASAEWRTGTLAQ